MSRACLVAVLCSALCSAHGAHTYGARPHRPASNQLAACPKDTSWVSRQDRDFFRLHSQSWQDGYLAYVFQVGQ
jgi:hypothetical protein